MEPGVKVALIVAIPSTITGIGTLLLGFLNRQDNKSIKLGVDGINSRIQTKSDAQGEELADKSNQLAHAQGRREGMESK